MNSLAVGNLFDAMEAIQRCFILSFILLVPVSRSFFRWNGLRAPSAGDIFHRSPLRRSAPRRGTSCSQGQLDQPAIR